MTVKWIGGAPPELVLFDVNGAELERASVEHLSVAELEALLASKGFASAAAGAGGAQEEGVGAGELRR